MKKALPSKLLDVKKELDNELVVSYLTLRNFIGFSGMLLLIILILTTARGSNDKFIESSISEYYYTTNGDVFVVLLSVLGVFLLTYNGYSVAERALTILAAICSIGVAFSPTATEEGNSMSIHKIYKQVPEWFGIERHVVLAATFFLCIALISLIYFPKTNQAHLISYDGKKTSKAKRNTVYKICGWVILLMMLLLIINFVKKPFPTIPVTFILEAIALEAFGFSWITKGQTLWHDGEHYLTKGLNEIKASVK
ncbi:hypothetical protein [Hymenobacter bucti]|uniref:DUF998 domain-containing protein n=1 Tax=Hymenobacter bucti TaxID=1844114 RepID=A0ABW4R1K5_9BACT